MLERGWVTLQEHSRSFRYSTGERYETLGYPAGYPKQVGHFGGTERDRAGRLVAHLTSPRTCGDPEGT